jgi:phosphoribosylaminoimidazolecarboxamide formyltransferase/IMP cyclohydrolase
MSLFDIKPREAKAFRGFFLTTILCDFCEGNKNMNYSIRCALISVSEKSGIESFADSLHRMGVKLLSTGGTASLLKKNNIPTTPISDYTGFPEIMDGRVKTLHPKIYGGILSRQNQDQSAMEQYGIEAIELVVVNLYPFERIASSPESDLAIAIENIDIGGVTLLRAAAKNYKYVTVIVDENDYLPVLNHIQQGTLTEEIRFELAKKAFSHVAAYDIAIANYFSQKNSEQFPGMLLEKYQKKQMLRYGENPHQQAALYVEPIGSSDAIVNQLQGKDLSFNNMVDADTALSCVRSFSEPACVIVKHANPCGVAICSNSFIAYKQAYLADPTSAFGGVIALNRSLDLQTANEIIENQFVEVVLAPSIEDAALNSFSKKSNVRLLLYDINQQSPEMEYKRVYNGLLVQTCDNISFDEATLRCVTKRKPTPSEYQDLLFAWRVAQFVKSNAIVFAKNKMTIGIGAGQTSRIYSAKVAIMKALDVGLDLQDSVMASDAFFPFRDGIDAAAKVGVSAIIQPGGSMRDKEVIAAADEANIAMIFTGIRHFRH